MYSIHPGAVAVPTDLTSTAHLDRWLGDYTQVAEAIKESLKGFKDSSYWNGMVCVALATGIAKGALKGQYFDAQQDLQDVISQADAITADPELYTLHKKFLGGLRNDGGTEIRPAEDSFEFTR
ncbi:Dehydrogenase reductase SDR family member 7B [Fusarium beomiforme]|uniref:Dehydrogenase reductase SDR family member 7B n=1 Tax=Fusarium beomiforme TaxID=44412 RepID=A0A9P5A3I3_9HYPO|nr:Dehydrogenase reductase SDR family member 7B [Fusarium beomiforme]